MLTSSNMRVLGHLALLLFASPLLAQSPPTYQTELNTLADRVAHDIKAVTVTPGTPLTQLFRQGDVPVKTAQA